MTRSVLLIEDEPGLVLTIRDRLQSEGYRVVAETDGSAGYERALRDPFDAIILDLMLPGKDGCDICRDLRSRDVATPVLMLTARGQLVDRVLGLKLGADDYLTKPFEMLELIARLEAILRRTSRGADSSGRSFRFGDVLVDLRSGEVRRNLEPVPLSAKEFQLLCYLIDHRGELLSRDHLLDHVWGYNAMPATRTVDVHIAGLRQKLEPYPSRPRFILTVHGLGYKFVP